VALIPALVIALGQQSVEQFEHFLGWPGQHRAVPPNDHRSLHQCRMLQQNVDYCLSGDIIRRLQAKIGKRFVLPHQIRWGIRQQIKTPLQVCPAQGLFEVFYDVELDASVTQQVLRAPALASARVVIEQ
jgi:hypothetical protein